MDRLLNDSNNARWVYFNPIASRTFLTTEGGMAASFAISA